MDFIRQLDIAILIFINHDLSNSLFDNAAPLLREKTTWIPLYIIIAFLLYKQKKNQAFIWIIAAVLLVIVSDQTALFTKNYFQRLRPCNDPELAGLILLKLKNCSSSFSFVSAHAANHFAQAVLYSLIFKKWYAWTGFIFWALAVCFSQIYVGIHFPTDIAAGAILGVVLGLGCYKITEHFSRKFYS